MLLGDTPRRGEHGFSLVESVIAVAVLGIIASAMVGGMATSIATSDIHRQQSVANAVMVSAAETVKNAPYVTCASSGDAVGGTYSMAHQPPAPGDVLPTGPPLLPAGTAPWPPSAITTTVRYWNPQTSTWAASPNCHDTETPGDGLGGPFPMQKVTILVTNPGNRASTSVDIIKRGP